jgi:hypothetical protein
MQNVQGIGHVTDELKCAYVNYVSEEIYTLVC